VQQFFWVESLLGDPVWSYRLCVNEGNGWREIHAAQGMPRPPRMAADSLVCDLASLRADSTSVDSRETACRGTA